jgi:hypothetical protein
LLIVLYFLSSSLRGAKRRINPFHDLEQYELLRCARNDGRTRYFFVFRFPAAFVGTFLPLARASESPIAIACLRLFTVLPDRPLFKVPALRFFIARSTSAEAFLEYFRAMIYLPVSGK